MRLSISNIAWDVKDDISVVQLLREFQIDAIDIAPGKYFPAPADVTDDEIARVKKWWKDHGIDIIGMQALLFGTTGLNVFGDQHSQKAMLGHLRGICRIGAKLGATRLVFGSPKNRDRSGLTDQQALEGATQFFGKLGDIASEWGVIICLEPNPSCYGSNFMTTSLETAKVVQLVSHSSIRMQLDTGAVIINEENLEIFLSKYSSLIEHIHASDPKLVPLGDSKIDHSSIHCIISRFFPHRPVTVEMVATKNESYIDSIRRALKFAERCYRPK